MEDLSVIKDCVCREVDAMQGDLIALSKRIYEHPESGHTPEFREASGSAMGFDAMLLAAKGLAMTALDVMYRPGGSDEAWAAHRATVPAAR